MKFKRVKFKHPFIFGLLLLVVIVLVSALIMRIEQIRTSTSRPEKSSNTLFDGYGIYESCSSKASADCLSHLNIMAAAGFKLVINYSEMYGDASFQQAYLDHAQSVGMKVIVGLSNPTFYNGKDLRSNFPALAKTCNCTNNHGFIQYVVNLVKNHPAVWGYYIGDEVDPGDHDKMKSALADVVHQIDPKHPRLFIDNPGHTTATWHGNSPFARLHLAYKRILMYMEKIVQLFCKRLVIVNITYHIHPILLLTKWSLCFPKHWQIHIREWSFGIVTMIPCHIIMRCSTGMI